MSSTFWALILSLSIIAGIASSGVLANIFFTMIHLLSHPPLLCNQTFKIVDKLDPTSPGACLESCMVSENRQVTWRKDLGGVGGDGKGS
jgi:hypothetical protein